MPKTTKPTPKLIKVRKMNTPAPELIKIRDVGKRIILVAVYVSPGVSRGGNGIVILPGGRVIIVPPRQPGILAYLGAAANLVAIKGTQRQKSEMIATAGSIITNEKVLSQLSGLADIGRGETAVIFVSPGVMVDGGGFGITADGHIVPIPPWNPNIKAKLDLAAAVFERLPTLHEDSVRESYARFVSGTICDEVMEVVNKVAG